MKKGYIIQLSNKAEVQIDADELNVVIQGIKNGGMIRVKQGLVNPSFIVTIVVDQKRINNFLDDTKYDDEVSQERRKQGLEPLKDIFAEVLPKLEVKK